MSQLYNKIVITKKGGIENLKLIQEDKNQLYKNLKQNEAIIKVYTAGLAYADIMMREGTYPGHPPYPFTPGYDIIGQIEYIQENPFHLKKGNFVGALTVTGGYSEYIKLPIEKLMPISYINKNHKIPDIKECAELVSLILNYITAYQLLFRIKKLNSDSYILIHGGGGGVGTALIQLTQYYGFKNTYTTISKRKYDLIQQYNVKPIFYQEESFVEYCKKNHILMDLILDPIGGMHFLDSYKILNKNGVLVLYGTYNFLKQGTLKSMAGVPLTYLRNLFSFNRKKVVFYLIGQKKFGGYNSVKEDFSILVELYKNKHIQPIIDTIYPLTEENVKIAHKRLQEGDVRGKIVFRML
ncbi:MAG: NADPH:quinone reductase [Leptospiraceae bacterium]|nr:MAG: NADPH:quinone reductase [Leptospiraceae bacterium]